MEAQYPRVTITITRDQLDAIDELASVMRVSRSAVIRSAIDWYLTLHASKAIPVPRPATRSGRLRSRSEEDGYGRAL